MAKQKMMEIPVKQYEKLFKLVEKMADQVEDILLTLENMEEIESPEIEVDE